jgi:DNA-directed RNA polymerase specialized sigma24 family protein
MRSVKDEFLDVLCNYQGILHKVSLIYFKNQADREDNLQEIIYQLWKSYPTIRSILSNNSPTPKAAQRIKIPKKIFTR